MKDRPSLNKSLIRIIRNWIAQGYFYIDPTERIFKLVLEILIAIPIFLLISLINIENILVVVLLTIFITHSVTWLVNGSIYMILLDQHLVKIRKNELKIKYDYIMRVNQKVKKINSISTCVIFGSMARNELHERSDIDIRMIRKRGVFNGITSCLYAFRERFYCFIYCIPLDGGYVGDSIIFFRRMRTDEYPIIIKDEEKLIINNYDNYKYISDYSDIIQIN